MGPDDVIALYREHAPALTGYFARRTGDAEAAADLVGETFAAALAGRTRFDPDRGQPVEWLYGIARHQLTAFRRHGVAQDRARRRLRMERLEPTDVALERIEALAAADRAVVVTEAVESLPADQRDAVRARFLHGQSYDEIAAAAGTTSQTVRQRVSRALTRLRGGLTREDT